MKLFQLTLSYESNQMSCIGTRAFQILLITIDRIKIWTIKVLTLENQNFVK